MDILNVTKALKEALDLLKGAKREKQNQFQLALRNLHTALNETRICIGRSQVTRDDEERLARLWAEAGFTLSEFDHELTLRCDLKAQYWANPNSWTDKDIDEMNIGLEGMTRDIRTLLTEPNK